MWGLYNSRSTHLGVPASITSSSAKPKRLSLLLATCLQAASQKHPEALHNKISLRNAPPGARPRIVQGKGYQGSPGAPRDPGPLGGCAPPDSPASRGASPPDSGPRPWSMFHGPWSLVPGSWSQSLLPDACSLVPVPGSWSLIPGLWCLMSLEVVHCPCPCPCPCP